MTPKGFWSYARGDDAHLDRRLSDLRGRVAGEISMLLGREVDMFQDIYDIRVGDNWKERLRGELTAASFMIPVLTPRYFERPWCREEVTTFLQLAREAGHEPLLFPIYFVKDRRFDREDHCDVRAAVASYQFLDWRELRFESDPTRIDRAIHDFADDVVERIEDQRKSPFKVSVAPSLSDTVEPVTVALPEPPVTTPERSGPPEVIAAKPATPEVETLIVDPWPDRGDYMTVVDALRAARPGARILVRPHVYEGGVVVDKQVEIIGDGPPEEIVIEAEVGHAMIVSASIARISGLTIRRGAGPGRGTALWIVDGRAEIADCLITNRGFVAVAIAYAGSAPVLRRCHVMDSPATGIVVHDGARPTIEECEVAGNMLQGVEVLRGAEVSIWRSTLHRNQYCGAVFYDGGRGLLSDCVISENRSDGVTVQTDGAPVLRGCSLIGNGRHGVRIKDDAGVTTVENTLFEGNRADALSPSDFAGTRLITRGNTYS